MSVSSLTLSTQDIQHCRHGTQDHIIENLLRRIMCGFQKLMGQDGTNCLLAVTFISLSSI
jgi:hypothetical protein